MELIREDTDHTTGRIAAGVASEPSGSRSKRKRSRRDRSASVARSQNREANEERRGHPSSLGEPTRRPRSPASLGGPTHAGSTSSSGVPESVTSRADGTSEEDRRSPNPSYSGDGGEDDGYPSSSEEDAELVTGKRTKRHAEGAGLAAALSCFDPAALVKASEGAFKPPEVIKTYLNKHLRRCLSKEEREALFREHPRPDLESCSVPQVDKFIADFIGKKLVNLS